MRIDVFTLIPDWFGWFAGQRHVRNALDAGHTLEAVDLRATTPLSAGQVDDPPYGGGAGMVIRVDVVAAALPDPATLGPRMTGVTCAGLLVTGTGRDGAPRSVYLYHLADNAVTMREYDSQCVVWQTALNPVIALELLATGVWSGIGVQGPEAFDARPFLELMARPVHAGGYGEAWGIEER